MIAFVAAERRELLGIERHLTDRRVLDRSIDYAVTGTMNGRPVVLAANGPGRSLVAAAIRALQVGPLAAVVSVGYCGALASRLRPCEVFVATSVNGIAVDRPRQTPGSAAEGPLVTVDRVVTTIEDKRDLHLSGAEAVDMEAAEVVDYARESKTDFHCIRVVTDTAREAFGIDFNLMRDKAGRFSRARIVFQAFQHPSKLFPELIQLDRRCKSASLALGDFIADCQF
jgi:nucleoside phosphorylase